MTASKGKTAGKESPRIRWPMFWSSTAHLLAVLSLLALGGGGKAGPLRGVVDVILVRAAGEGRAAANRPAPHPSIRKSGDRTVPRGAPGGPPAKVQTPSAATRETPWEPPPPVSGGGDPGAVIPDAPVGPGKTIPAGERTGPAGPLLSSPGQPPEGSLRDSSGPGTASLDPGLTAGGSLAGPGNALLRERIQSRIVYPEEAVRRGQQGEVLLRIRVGTGGLPREIRIARSSGARLLDEAARRGVFRAAPLPSDPGWVEVPVLFRLR